MDQKKILKFSDEVTDVVSGLNLQFLKEGRLATNPDFLFYHSYDAHDIANDKTPDDAICRFTISGLKFIFPLIKIELGEDTSIIVENEVLGDYSAFIEIKDDFFDHINYIKIVMLDIFILYQNDEDKIPKKMYKWYFKK